MADVLLSSALLEESFYARQSCIWLSMTLIYKSVHAAQLLSSEDQAEPSLSACIIIFSAVCIVLSQVRP